jgi:hypothetical protein
LTISRKYEQFNPDEETHMIHARLLALFLFTTSLTLVTAQPLVRDIHQAQEENVRFALMYDVDADVVGDDYHGFMISYASKIYPLDQMVVSFAHQNPEHSTMLQVSIGIEEFWPISENLIPYGTASGGYIHTDYDEDLFGDQAGWFGSLGVGLLFKTGTAFDFYGELVYQVSLDDLWIDGMTASKNNNTYFNAGVRLKF